MLFSRKYPIGAELVSGGGAHFRVWAPRSKSAAVEFFNGTEVGSTLPLKREPEGYFAGVAPQAAAGARYKYKLDHGSFPDPASRAQPDGPHGPSQLVDSTFAWTDAAWRGRPASEIVCYELHLGTFTREGTWRAAMAELPELARLGITLLEIMPIAEFDGRFGWGYDGVDLFAPTRLYGTPDDARAFINRAHELRLMVILDVVYNHFGPAGNYLREFSPDYFSTKYVNEWGDPINFDGGNSGPVREFFLANARYWIAEYHFDGLRLDATQQIFDASPTHIIAEIGRAARAAAGDRRIWIVAEDESQRADLVRACETDRAVDEEKPPGPSARCGLDAIWNDDFHHAARVAASGHHEAYLSGFRGTAAEFVAAAKYGFLYQGQWYQWQEQRRGTPALDLKPRHFVHFLENHDQVSNAVRGRRLQQRTSAAKARALTGLLLLSPQIPLLFQGQEFAASTPFVYFADHGGELGRLVSEGRWKFLTQFPSEATAEARELYLPPGDPETFRRCVLDFRERERNADTYRLHEDLLRLRREDPVIAAPRHIDGAVLGERVFVLRFFSASRADDRLLCVNLGTDAWLEPAPEPLLAPIAGHGWRILWSSQTPRYGGSGTAPLETTANWRIPGEAAVLLAPDENCEPAAAERSQKN